MGEGDCPKNCPRGLWITPDHDGFVDALLGLSLLGRIFPLFCKTGKSLSLVIVIRKKKTPPRKFYKYF